jgi:glycosyltransferase involved in cell wall biosynthesis
MNTIHITIPAYNAEKTLRRAIDSVLAQTYKNFKIYVLDDASTDNTRAIIDEYAEKHGIIPFYNNKNRSFDEKSSGFLDLSAQIPPDDFWTRLDADDELFPDCFETLINFANENDLDIAAGNYIDYYVAEGVGKPRSKTDGEDFFFFDKKDYAEKFLDNLDYFMPLWAKLFRGTVSGAIPKNFITPTIYGHDSLGNIAAILESKRVGCTRKPLLRYNVTMNSVCFTYKSNRKDFPEMHFNALIDCMQKKAGAVTHDDLTKIFVHWANFVRSTFATHLRGDIPNESKFEDVEYFFKNRVTRDLFTRIDYFNLIAHNHHGFDILQFPLEWIYENRKTLPPERVVGLYYLFFDVIYQIKPVKFTNEEILYMLGVNIPLANSLLLGLFDNANAILAYAPDSALKRSVAGKVERLK